MVSFSDPTVPGGGGWADLGGGGGGCARAMTESFGGGPGGGGGGGGRGSDVPEELGLGGAGGGGGTGKAIGIVASSPKVDSVETGKGGSGGGAGTGKGVLSDPGSDLDVDAPAPVAPVNGILGPIDDLYIGGFPGGGAPLGLRVG